MAAMIEDKAVGWSPTERSQRHHHGSAMDHISRPSSWVVQVLNITDSGCGQRTPWVGELLEPQPSA